MDLEALRIFIDVMHRGSFAAVARERSVVLSPSRSDLPLEERAFAELLEERWRARPGWVKSDRRRTAR